MSFKEETRNMSNEELIKEIRSYSCNPHYRVVWNVAMNELEIRLGTKSKEIEEAIRYFKYGISHDLFSEDMIRIAKVSIEALERIRDEL